MHFFFLIFIPMRSFGGGLHLKKYSHCYIVSCLILTFSLLIVKYCSFPEALSLVFCFASCIILFCVGPINHPNREASANENLLFIRRTNITLLFCIVISVVLYATNLYHFLFLETIVLLFLCITALIAKLVPNS